MHHYSGPACAVTEAITSRQRRFTLGGYLANLEMVPWFTWKVLAMARQLSPAASRLSASACWCSLSLSVRPFVDVRNSRGQRNPSKAAFELTPWQVRPAWLRWCAANVRACRNPVAGCAPRARSRACHMAGHLVDALLFQKLTQALIVKADGLGNMPQWHPALDQLARRTHLFG